MSPKVHRAEDLGVGIVAIDDHDPARPDAAYKARIRSPSSVTNVPIPPRRIRDARHDGRGELHPLGHARRLDRGLTELDDPARAVMPEHLGEHRREGLGAGETGANRSQGQAVGPGVGTNRAEALARFGEDRPEQAGHDARVAVAGDPDHVELRGRVARHRVAEPGMSGPSIRDDRLGTPDVGHRPLDNHPDGPSSDRRRDGGIRLVRDGDEDLSGSHLIGIGRTAGDIVIGSTDEGCVGQDGPEPDSGGGTARGTVDKPAHHGLWPPCRGLTGRDQFQRDWPAPPSS